MSRIPKWKFEKNKVKVVFRLQFHATHIPQTGWDKLFTNKANVRNGTCKWADPIYETTRLLLQDTSAKKYDEKFYKLGTSRSSFLGEAYINLADYADALKPTSVVLPLQGCDFGTILHVSIQLLTSKTGFREFEQQRETREKGFHLISNPSQEHVRKLGDSAERTMDKANARVRFRQVSKELYSLEEMDEPDEDFDESAAGVDGSSCTSDSMYAEKVDISSTHGSSTKITNDGGQINQTESRHESPHHLLVQSTNERAHGWSSDFSVDNSLSSLYDENIKMRECLEVAESSILVMSTEINSLQCLAGELGADTQRLTHQFTAELASGEALLEEVSVLKSECSKLKDEFEVLRHYKRMLHLNGRRVENLHNPVVFSGISPDNFHSIKEWADKPCYLEKRRSSLFPECQSQCLEVVTLLEKKLKILRSKMQVRYHENDVDCLSDFDGVDCVLQNLKQCIMLSSSDMNPVKANTNATQVTGIKHLIPLQTLLDQELDNRKMMKERICELLTELEESKAEQEALTRKMNQKVLHYDALILELEQRNKQTLNELDNVRAEHSSSLSTVSAFRSQIEKMRHDMNEQFAKLSEDKWYLESVNKELEKRVMASETVLKRIRCTYSTAVDRLQKDLELLSAQVLSMFETNENLAKQALAEVPKLYFDEHVEEHPEFMKSRLRNDSQPKFDKILDKSNDLDCHQEPCPFSNAADLGYKTGQSFDPASDYKDSLFTRMPIYAEQDIKDAGSVNGTDLREGKTRPEDHRLNEKLYLNMEEELHEVYTLNVDLEILVKVLQETLREKNYLVGDMKEKMDELSQQLDRSTKSEGLLTLKLQDAFDGIRVLREDVTKFSVKCEDLTVEKYILHENLQDVYDKIPLSHKKRLRCICSNIESYGSQVYGPSFASVSIKQELENNDHLAVVSHLEELQMEAFEKILKLNEEMNKTKKEKDSLHVFLKDMGSELLLIKQKSESELEEITLKLDLSNSLNRTSNQAESEQKLVDRNRDLTSKLTIMEYKLQDADNETRDISKKLLEFDRIYEELERSRMDVVNCRGEKETLVLSLQSMKESTFQLENELSNLKEQLKCGSEELKTERVTKVKLEDTITNLTSQLNEKNEQILSLQEQNAELVHLRLQLSNYESEKSGLQNLLLHHEERRGNLDDEMFSLHDRVADLFRELSSLKEALRSKNDELHAERLFRGEMEGKIAHLTSQLNAKREQVLSLNEQNSELAHLRQQVINLESDKSAVEQQLLLCNDKCSKELDAQLSILHSQVMNLDTELCKTRERLGCACDELHSEREIRGNLEATISDLTSLLNEKQEQLLHFGDQKVELANLRQQLLNLESEKFVVDEFLLSSKERIGELDTEISVLYSQVADLDAKVRNSNKCLRFTENELHSERDSRLKLESAVSELTSLLNEKQEQLVSFEEIKAELTLLRQAMSDIKSENSELQKLLLRGDELCFQMRGENSLLNVQITDLETHVCVLHKLLLSANIEATFIGSQYQTNMQELFDKFRILEESNKELQKNHLDVVAELQNCMAIKDYCYKENERLLEDHKLLKSALELSEHSKYPLDSMHERTVKSEKVDGLKVDAPELGIDDYVEKNYFPKEIEPFKLLLDFEEEMEHLRSSKDEHEIAGIILMSKLYEQQEHITFLQESHSELINLQGQHKELMHRLSEQILKTEEFKNLSIRLKELKDKADAETNQIREKRNSEAPSGAVVESLRVAFIKDQCEIKVQELQSQLDISKKHGEDILMKLQNALDEVELRKKSEASHVKRNEELSIKVLELESEMQLVVANRREFVKAYDEIKAELECSIISTECCKEEKFKLEASLGECNENLKNLRVELELTKRQLDSLTATSENLGSHDADIVGSVGHKYGEDAVVSQRNGRQVSIRGYADPDAHFREKSSEPFFLIFLIFFSGHSISLSLIPNRKRNAQRGGPLLEDTEYMASVEEQKREQQNLRVGIDRLQQEANQRLGMIFPSFQEFPGHGNALERVLALELELAEALQAKKKPEIVFQRYGGNPHDLAHLSIYIYIWLVYFPKMKIDLGAQRLVATCFIERHPRGKKWALLKVKPESDEDPPGGLSPSRSTDCYPLWSCSVNSSLSPLSSFLRQLGDEAAVLQSFRDINELIGDTLNVRGRHAAMESELKEMHCRYSQLSLQFAEMEGERQKLLMKLKNIRSPRKAQP
ncbi:unnamed protein product [Spirodela intermedia]|uniref:C2 NT-type domain-containing protein n=1 Tax=Spirodela intermedia TaxID=51605 RepID=A0A7I8J4T5_SPIIN|nr:unnamed protein product [Spirodela intermedia]CAA6665089.1 unnamed protein product [Spirodela intermedia]